jgi:hypothetical protein
MLLVFQRRYGNCISETDAGAAAGLRWWKHRRGLCTMLSPFLTQEIESC